VRFAPEEVGEYSAVAVLKDRTGETRSRAERFTATPSPSRGFIRISQRNPRYMEYADGSPYFAVGQNVAFITDSYLTADMIRKLGENGANYARVWACAEDWALAIESRKSAWGRSWSWKPPLAPMPGGEPGAMCIKLEGAAGATISANPSHPVGLKPAVRYRFRATMLADEAVAISIALGGNHRFQGDGSWQPISFEFESTANQRRLGSVSFRLASAGTAYFRDISLMEAGGGPELLTEADPNRPALGVYHQADCFMLDRVIEAAEEAGVKLQVVLLTRNLYMPDIGKDPAAYDRAIQTGKKLLRYAVARWGYSTSVMAWEYFNEMDPNKPTDRFYDALGAELERIDPYRHIRATSAWHSPAPRDYRHPRLDTADVHYYIRPTTGELYRDEVASVLERWRSCSPPSAGKPLLFSEFGITDDKWNRSGDLDKDREYAHLHSALWASALGGFASTVCHWYWADIHSRDLYHHYRGISSYAAVVPWTTPDLGPAAVKPSENVRVVGLQARDGAWLWINDPRATWWNLAVAENRPEPVKGATIQIQGLAEGQYRLEWWDTIQGTVISQQALRVSGQPARIEVPPFTRDIACRIHR
jgi:hypothetical protein